MSSKIGKRLKGCLAVHSGKEPLSLAVALEKLASFPKAKFDESVELAAHLGVDARQSTQMVRGTVFLPHGTGQDKKILAFTADAPTALNAGASYAGLEDLIEKIKGSWLDFDVAVATPFAMEKVRGIARILGPRGLMPNLKSGTVSEDIVLAIEEVKKGKVEYKMDKTANVTLVIGKRSFSAEALLENAQVAIESISKARPEKLKNVYIQSLALSGSMTPSIKLNIHES